MPNRILRQSILESPRVAQLNWADEVFYRRLMSIVDDYGRAEASPLLLRSKCYPLQTDQVRAADISRSMAACQKAGLIVCYDVGGKQYLELLRFGQKQRTDSKFPAPPAFASNCQQMSANALLDEGVCVVEDEGVVGGDARKPAQAVALPDWLPSDRFLAFVQHRKALKKPMTEEAKRLLVAKLEGLHAKGLNVSDLLNTAIERGWQTVYEPDGKRQQLPANAGNRNAAADWVPPEMRGEKVVTAEVV